MRLVFAGTPAFALPTLSALHTAGHTVVAVYTQPDRPAGRGRKLTPSPIKQYALDHQLPVRQPLNLRADEEQTTLAALAPEVMIVVAYGLLLPPAVLSIPRNGCLNVHASLLPRWRGAAPVARAIEAGDRETGITLMQMAAGLDTGPMLLQQRVPIDDTDTAERLEQRLAALGAEMMTAALPRLDRLTPEIQEDQRACYAAKLQKSEAIIDWSQPAPVLHRKIRALNPRPVASTTLHGNVLRLWDVGTITARAGNAAAGTIVAADANGVLVQTGDGVLALTQLQAAGGRTLPARDFLNGVRLNVGDRLGS
ncbi:MAG: methionyl-tRNA formyltransferase [Gammaproteobacteria bacterium]|nr:methionyl-tRNA formyltransferase [Gammaproteobacteria bacterium]